MQTLDFKPSNFLKIAKGKRTTIRKGYKQIELGLVSFTCENQLDTEYNPQITEVRYVRFGDLGLIDAVTAGFNSISELRGELQRCYQTLIADFEAVTVIRFIVD